MHVMLGLLSLMSNNNEWTRFIQRKYNNKKSQGLHMLDGQIIDKWDDMSSPFLSINRHQESNNRKNIRRQEPHKKR